MKSVRRFELQIEQKQQIEIPYDAEILYFGTHGGAPCIWALVDSSQKTIMRTFLIIADGAPVPQKQNRTRYIGSFRHELSSENMLHVFED